MKAGALQLTVERLSRALAKVEESEGLLRDKVQGLTEALTRSSASLTSTQDKNVQLQKALTACEHDRQVLQVWGIPGPSCGGAGGELAPGSHLWACPLGGCGPVRGLASERRLWAVMTASMGCRAPGQACGSRAGVWGLPAS